MKINGGIHGPVVCKEPPPGFLMEGCAVPGSEVLDRHLNSPYLGEGAGGVLLQIGLFKSGDGTDCRANEHKGVFASKYILLLRAIIINNIFVPPSHAVLPPSSQHGVAAHLPHATAKPYKHPAVPEPSPGSTAAAMPCSGGSRRAPTSTPVSSGPHSRVGLVEPSPRSPSAGWLWREAQA